MCEPMAISRDSETLISEGVYTLKKKALLPFLFVGPSPGLPGLELRQMQRTGETNKNGYIVKRKTSCTRWF